MSNTQTITNNDELQRESPVLTPSNEEVTAFGFGKEELLNRLRDEEEFSATFMTEYAVLQDIVKEFKKEKKEKEAAKRLAAKKEKEEGERVHLNSIILKIQEKDAEFAEVPDDLMTKEVALIKAWIKEYRSRVKEAKVAAKAEKAAAKEAKLAEKEAKAAAKAEKETVMREKLLIKIEKMLEHLAVYLHTDISDYQEKSLGELKIAHSHMKMIIHLNEWDEIIPNISYWTTGTKFEELKEIHTRAQLLIRLYKCKIDTEDDAMQDMHEKMNEFKKEGYKHKASVEEIKEFIKQVKGQ
jgi:hypothetical protein